MRPTLGGVLLSLLMLGFLSGASRASTDPKVWLAGVDPFVRARMSGAAPSDFESLFSDEATWPQATRRVSVFKVSTQWLAGGPDDALRQMIAVLNRRGIALGMEALMIPRHHDCGLVEGYSPPGEIARAARRVKALGGSLKYAAMDEPLWFGHFDTSPKACRSTMAEVASGLAENVRALREIFPDIQIGDIEPFESGSGHGVRPADEVAFAKAYAQATGTPLAFVHADLDWREFDPARLMDLKVALRGAGIRFGVIYDGNSDDPTDVAWTRNAESRFEMVDQRPETEPDDAILQTWMIRPTRMGPETAPGTMTNLVLSYAREITHLTCGRTPRGLVGTLMSESGASVGGAPITAWAIDSASARPISTRRLTGLVPDGAVKVLVGLRINVESNGKGAGEVLVGVPRYRRPSGAVIDVRLLNDAGRSQALSISRSQSLSRNAPAIPVSPGQPFDLAIPLGASAGFQHAGHVALIFLAADGHEVRRFKLPLTPTRSPVGSAQTDDRGRFLIATTAANAKSLEIDCAYSGNETRRGATALVP